MFRIWYVVSSLWLAGISWSFAGRPSWISNKQATRWSFQLVFGTWWLVDQLITSLNQLETIYHVSKFVSYQHLKMDFQQEWVFFCLFSTVFKYLKLFFTEMMAKCIVLIAIVMLAVACVASPLSKDTPANTNAIAGLPERPPEIHERLQALVRRSMQLSEDQRELMSRQLLQALSGACLWS